MLASDVNNPDFVNPQNPDSLLHVEFYLHKPVDQWETEQESLRQGKKVIVYQKEFVLVQDGMDELGNGVKVPRMVPKFTGKDKVVPYVRIMRPGDQTTILEVEVREDHKRRWPERWMYFQMQEGLIEMQKVPGWQIEEWPYLADKPQLMHELKYSRFQTVDQIAGASDSQVQKLGIGGMGLREQARVDLRGRVAKDAMAEIHKKDAEIAEMRERMAKLEAAVMAQAQPQAASQDQTTAEKPKRKYVRKAKPDNQATT